MVERRLTWDELVAIEPCLDAALQIASHHDSEWRAYESFKRLLHDHRILGWGADNRAVANGDAYLVAITHAADVLVPSTDQLTLEGGAV